MSIAQACPAGLNFTAAAKAWVKPEGHSNLIASHYDGKEVRDV